MSACIDMQVRAPQGWSVHNGHMELDSLELDLQMIMSQYVGAGVRTQVLCRNNQCSWSLSNLFGPI